MFLIVPIGKNPDATLASDSAALDLEHEYAVRRDEYEINLAETLRVMSCEPERV